ncbi:hypothetical protein EGK14_05005 [Erwinia sp. 198]|nr:hypothetical protein EGK14_05005 [Erwinia sp. 198]
MASDRENSHYGYRLFVTCFSATSRGGIADNNPGILCRSPVKKSDRHCQKAPVGILLTDFLFIPAAPLCR